MIQSQLGNETITAKCVFQDRLILKNSVICQTGNDSNLTTDDYVFYIDLYAVFNSNIL